MIKEKISLYYNTIKYLKPKQIYYQLKKKIIKKQGIDNITIDINNCILPKMSIKELDLESSPK